MLALTRKKNESIVIGDNIEVVILNVQGDQVKLGISAPKKVPVHRKEIYEQIKQENLAASKGHTESAEVKKVMELLKGKKAE